MTELTPEIIFAISSRIVEASTAGKDTAPGYRHGFIAGFAEAFKFLEKLEERKKLEKHVKQNLCENANSCDTKLAVNVRQSKDSGFMGEGPDCDDPGFYRPIQHLGK